MKFIIPINPVAQKRARAAKIAGHASIYKDTSQEKEERKLEAWIAELMLREGYEKFLADIPLYLRLKVYLPRPKSHFGTGRNARKLKKSAPIRPTTKPDLDNLLKHFKDVASGVIWHDDRQIVGYTAGTGKYYTDDGRARWEVEVTECLVPF